MRVSEILALLPEGGPVLAEYGLHCFGCAANVLETLEEGCVSHGFQDAEIDQLVLDLNTLLRDRPPRPEVLHVTLPAAKGLKEVMESEGRGGQGLLVTLDETGGFCLEFRDTAAKGEKTFFHREEPDVRVFASSQTLQRIGGSTIDLREGRFKLDLPDDLKPPTCGCGGGRCSCADRK